MSSNNLEVANIIRSQISNNAFMCWDSRDFMGGIGRSDCGYLTFTVSNNPKIPQKCFVTVALNGKDLYNVTVWKRDSKANAVVFNESKDVYCDMLEDIIFSMLG